MNGRYPSDWERRRRRVYRRDDYTCQNCGARGVELHAHHVVPKSKGGSDSLSNLKTLCKDCHEAIHQRDKMAPTADSRGALDGTSLVAGILIGTLRALSPLIKRYGFWPTLIGFLVFSTGFFLWAISVT